jgi:hypothetical protein
MLCLVKCHPDLKMVARSFWRNEHLTPAPRASRGRYPNKGDAGFPMKFSPLIQVLG